MDSSPSPPLFFFLKQSLSLFHFQPPKLSASFIGLDLTVDQLQSVRHFVSPTKSGFLRFGGSALCPTSPLL